MLGWFLLAGCAGVDPRPRDPLVFPRDTLGITNETRWVYGRDPATGRQVHVEREPAPTYALRCFVMARTVKRFHRHARFEPGGERLDEAGYRARVREVLSRSPRRWSAPETAVVFPGYEGLQALSLDWPRLFQEECGGGWQSYVQRGHWRMIFPFSRRGQAAEADRLAKRIRRGDAPVVHLVDFPGLKINHAAVAWGVTEDGRDRVFRMYDPNLPGVEVALRFDGQGRRFVLGPLPYFIGGEINVYEVYTGWLR